MAVMPPPTSVSLSQRFSNTAGPSTSLFAATGEFHQDRKRITNETADVCAAQMNPDNHTHGNANSVSFDFDKSTGYLPPGDHFMQDESRNWLRTIGSLNTGKLSLDDFLHCVSSERLHRMPHRASKWDRAIRLLECTFLILSEKISDD